MCVCVWRGGGEGEKVKGRATPIPIALALSRQCRCFLQVSEDDAAFDLATSHRTTWAQDQEWVKSHGQDAPSEELEKRLADTRQGLAAMEAAREAQRQQVKTKLSSRVDDLIRSFKVRYSLNLVRWP